MIQLSSPQPENIPVLTGKSPEKAVPASAGEGRFERALEQRRSESRSDGKSEAAKDERNNISLRTEKDSKKSEKTATAGDGAEASVDRAAEKKNGRDRIAAVILNEAGGDTGKQDAGTALLSLIASKSAVKTTRKNDTPLSAETGLSAGKGDKGAAALPVGQLLADASDGKAGTAGTAGTAEGGEDAALSLAAADLPAAPQPALPDASAETEGNGLFQSVLAGEKKAQDSPLSARLAKKSGSALRKMSGATEISVEDRRTPLAAEDGVVLKKVERNAESNSVTLELAAGTEEELPGMMLKADGDGGSAAKFSLQTAEESKGAALLDRQLKSEGSSELAKNIRFVLKDNNEGEIKLILKPEALGKVRINLNLNENNIVGKIIVENNSVRQVFMNNLADLSRALEDSGFNSAALDVSVGGGQSEGRGAYRDERPVYFADNALDDLEDMIPVVYDEGHSLSQINLVV